MFGGFLFNLISKVLHIVPEPARGVAGRDAQREKRHCGDGGADGQNELKRFHGSLVLCRVYARRDAGVESLRDRKESVPAIAHRPCLCMQIAFKKERFHATCQVGGFWHL